MQWESLVLVVAIWLLTLVVAVYCIRRPPLPRLDRWPRSVSEHLSADGRARALMREMLSEAEYQQLTKFGYLEVSSPNNAERVYRIPGAGGLVRVYERGTAIMELCLQPVEPLPEGDVIVLHKLMIQGNEQEYLAKANHFAPGIISLRYHL
ncbi:MAG TPA: hypothetical protein VIG30_05135 [Ktedonobacterales bacterium]|jgi:hypothetical protein